MELEPHFKEPQFEDAELVDKLLDPQLSGERLWDDLELREILEHQLSAPLAVDLRLLGAVAALEAAGLCEQVSPSIRTYRELFHHPAPPQRLLMLVKRIAQLQLQAAEPQLPGRIARFLYFTPIALARLRGGHSISRLSDKEVIAGLTWLLEQPWLDNHTRDLLQDAKRALNHDPPHEDTGPAQT